MENYFKTMPFEQAADKMILEARHRIHNDIFYMCVCGHYGWNIHDWIMVSRLIDSGRFQLSKNNP